MKSSANQTVSLFSHAAVLKALCCFFLWITCFGVANARTLYVVDSFVITVRTGPGGDYHVIESLKTGDKVDELERSGDWTRVQFSEDREGWVLSRYLQEDIPDFLVVQKLTSDAKINNEHIKQLEKENNALTTKYNMVQEQFAELSKEHQELQTGAQEYLKLKEEYESIRKGLEEVTNSNQQRALQIEALQDIRKVQWFLAGAGVIFGGWLMGFVTGRMKMKKKHGLTFSLK